jgi:prepilin-type N-terminal cleavage/methylation domain-containing protein
MKPSVSRFAFRASRPGFTILELMLSIGIFAMVLVAIYATWIAILRGSQAGLKAAAEVQRARIAMRTLEGAFNSAEMFVANMNYYLFIADTSGDMAAVSLAARVPDDFLGANQFKMLDQKVRRVSFYTEPGRAGMAELKMTIAPIMVDTNQNYQPYTLTLAKDVTLFKMAFFDLQKNEWLDEWKYTNRLPVLVQVALGLGKTGNDASKPYDLVTSLVALPSVAVQPDVQGGGPRQVLPGQGLPGQGLPGQGVNSGGKTPGSGP